MTTPDQATLTAKWPGRSLWQTFRALDRVPPAAAEAARRALAEAAALDPADAATRLLTALPHAWRALPSSEKKHAVAGIGEMIRAGGDPAAALDALALAAQTHGVKEQAGHALRDVVWHGFSLAPIIASLQATWATGDDYTRGRLDAALRLHRIAERHGRAIVSRLTGRSGALSRLLEEALAADEPPPHVHAQLETDTAHLPFVRAALLDPALRVFAIAVFEGMTRAPTAATLAALSAALPGIAAGLADPACAPVAARCVSAALAAGCDATPIRAAIEAGRGSRDRSVRVELSQALSKWLVATGQEPALPFGLSHRRTYAIDDTPIDASTRPCKRCGGVTVLIYSHREGGNTWAEEVDERRCGGCGLYSVTMAGY